MKLYHDQDADLAQLDGKRIAIVGYGNQGRSQALNLRDSGLEVIVGNREDEYAERAREDGFSVSPIKQAAAGAEVVLLLIPDEVAPEVLELEVKSGLAPGDALVFASGYNVAFGYITPPTAVDVVLLAPRMIGAGVRDLYVAGHGFPSFIGVAQDHSGQAKELVLALAKGIGSTRMGAVEVTFTQEAELDLFTEQCFGPAFGNVLTTSVNLLLDEGYPPEAVLLELYMSGEFSYTLAKIAEVGLIEQTALHSRTSQYGSMSRAMRFILPELRATMQEGLDEIRSGKFAQEWAEEQAAGAPTLEVLKESARSLPMFQLEQELRQELEELSHFRDMRIAERVGTASAASPFPASVAGQGTRTPATAEWTEGKGFLGGRLARLRRLRRRRSRKQKDALAIAALSERQMEAVLHRFLEAASADPSLQEFSQGRVMTTHYMLSDTGQQFYVRFEDGSVVAELGTPPAEAEVRLETRAEVLDGMFTGRINAMRAAMTGKLTFKGDAKLAIGIQQIQDELKRLYSQARRDVL